LDYIAAEVCEYNIRIVEKAFFEHVAPVCYTNVLGPVPSVWPGFDEVYLIEEITTYQSKKKTMTVKSELAAVRYYCKKAWLDLKN